MWAREPSSSPGAFNRAGLGLRYKIRFVLEDSLMASFPVRVSLGYKRLHCAVPGKSLTFFARISIICSLSRQHSYDELRYLKICFRLWNFFFRGDFQINLISI
ncbi:hypothetical protein HS088_TW11G00166 [Tripterygium wilfordii]|uniref:Uncharacterized protein n=1 Tax=Tripterygium wilfordii TaxID=458696 RepID=A0A7J7D165_TRIWF|nr:hypothetical protein HS088_TW11G00166 [Tripterygium wilfordii]